MFLYGITSARDGSIIFLRASKRRPLFVFFHGGYWQRNNKECSLSSPTDPRHTGSTSRWSATRSRRMRGFRRSWKEINRPCPSWRSAQAILDLIAIGCSSEVGRPEDILPRASPHPAFHGGLAISGIFDLEPISLNYLNDALKLTPREIEELSPIKQPMQNKPIFLATGERELSELGRQSQIYFERAEREKKQVTMRILPGHHHYSILEELFEKDGALTEALLQLAR